MTLKELRSKRWPATTNFVAAQEANRRSTFILLAVLTLLAAWFGYLIGWVLQSEATDRVPLVSGAGLVLASGLAIVSVVWSLISPRLRQPPRRGDGRCKGDRQGRRAAALQRGRGDVDRLRPAEARGLVMETEALNAFATGLSPCECRDRGHPRPDEGAQSRRAAGCGRARDGARAQPRHPLHGDVGVTVGLIALISDLVLRTLRLVAAAARAAAAARRAAARACLIIVLIVVPIMAPIAAKLVRLAVSRQREYLADATSVQFTRNPEGLISALQKLAAAAATLSRSEPCHAAFVHRQPDQDLHSQVLGAPGHASRRGRSHRSPAQSGRLARVAAAGFDLQAHRGGRGLAPENTLAAFRNALSLGVTTLET